MRGAFDFWNSAIEINAYKTGNIAGAYHFTQTVWKASKKIGCAWSTNICAGNNPKDWWFYCDFDPKGNITPYYAGNVTV
jgi:pathogenesis-related protein 1